MVDAIPTAGLCVVHAGARYAVPHEAIRRYHRGVAPFAISDEEHRLLVEEGWASLDPTGQFRPFQLKAIMVLKAPGWIYTSGREWPWKCTSAASPWWFVAFAQAPTVYHKLPSAMSRRLMQTIRSDATAHTSSLLRNALREDPNCKAQFDPTILGYLPIDDTPARHKRTREEPATCAVCLHGAAEFASIPCGHKALCAPCAVRCLNACFGDHSVDAVRCPVCRSVALGGMHKIYT